MHNRPYLFGFIPLPTAAEILHGLTVALVVQSTITPTFEDPSTYSPNCKRPSGTPSVKPTFKPTTFSPTRIPTLAPSIKPTRLPTQIPTQFPTPNLVSIESDRLSVGSIKSGETAILQIYGKFSDGSVRNITRAAIIESSNTSVINVTSLYTANGGIVLQGINNGWAIIRYRVNNMTCLRPITMTVWPQRGCFKTFSADYPPYNIP